QTARRHDQDHHAAGTRGRSGSQRSAVARQAARGPQTAAIARGRQGMTVTRGLALFLTVAAAGALVKASGPAAGTPTVRLKTISARTSGSGASLVIEASEPVAYSLTRPDALTVLVDFRNVTHDEVANTVAGNAKGAIAKVSVEQVESLGAPTARVRIALAQPVAHHARSDRNTVVIDFEKPSAKTPPYVTPKQTTTDARGTLDAMAALQQPQTPPQPTPPQVAAVDPIAALGLDGGPSASAPSVPPAQTPAPAAPVQIVVAPPAARAAAAAQQQPVPPSSAQVEPSRPGRQYS